MWLLGKLMFQHERFLDHSLSEIYPLLNSPTFTGNWMYLHWFSYDDKCEYIDFRNVINFQIHLLFLAAGLLEDKAREKSIVNVTFFSNPLLCLKQDDFKITQTDGRKGTEDYITVSLV